mmetsp:Transcript_104159/g.294558  ORF Transcript_104159/g.294558 Transcript_104159/m.294558 type:complete len:222 (+) Transcript_104159:272-937(+)
MASSRTDLPVCWNMSVTGMVPPLRTRSGATPCTFSVARLPAEKLKSSVRWQKDAAACSIFTSSWLGLRIASNSLVRCRLTSTSTCSGSMPSTSRIETLPTTVPGMTVLQPCPEKAPCTPWMDKDGLRHVRSRMSTLVDSRSLGAPRDCVKALMSMSMPSKLALSASATGTMSSSTPGTRMRPEAGSWSPASSLTSSSIGSWTAPPRPLWRSFSSPATVTKK